MPKSRVSSKNLGLTQKFARYLATQRSKRKWSLRELASRSGISLTRLWNYEQGNHSPNLTALVKMARAFGMPLSRFVKPLE